ncbi:flagellar assembly protein FliH [Gilvimarinus polysaccharolyticus]|uniref:flagellar assembly protein FliH n=1 Tax=Gilvimarinus polysaccharolyticus TaxID=863921 RepID=UPI00067366FD|nr:flagellar assembly protein FliH [Gilvimarinus polysaccharolyticus]
MVDKPKASANRIPADQSDAWQSWALPSVGRGDGIIKGKSQSKSAAKGAPESGETIEDIEVEGLTGTGLTAEQMSEIVQAAEQEGYAQGFEQAQKKGYEEGYQQGQERGAEDIRQLLSTEQQTFASLVQALKEPVDEQDEKLEMLLLTIVERISRAVIERDLITQPVDIIPLIRQSIAALPTPGNNVTLHLNLADHDCVQRYAAEHGHDWKLQVTPDISAGGVRVSTEDSVVDNTVERRFDETIERFAQRQDLDETTSDEQLLAREHPVEPAAGDAPQPLSDKNVSEEAFAPDELASGTTPEAELNAALDSTPDAFDSTDHNSVDIEGNPSV